MAIIGKVGAAASPRDGIILIDKANRDRFWQWLGVLFNPTLHIKDAWRLLMSTRSFIINLGSNSELKWLSAIGYAITSILFSLSLDAIFDARIETLSAAAQGYIATYLEMSIVSAGVLLLALRIV